MGESTVVGLDALGPNEAAFAVGGILVGILVCAIVARGLWRRRRRQVLHQRLFEQERRRIAQQLHDTVGHNLIVLALQARRLGSTNPHLLSASNELDATVRTTLNDLRRAVGTLRGTAENVGQMCGDTQPPVSGQLRDVIGRLANSGYGVELDIVGMEYELPIGTHTAILRVVREGLTNAIKHAPGRAVEVRLSFGAHPSVEVLTHGAPSLSPGVVGIDAGLGLKGLRELVEDQGGTFESGQVADGSFRICACFGPSQPVVPADRATVRSAS